MEISHAKKCGSRVNKHQMQKFSLAITNTWETGFYVRASWDCMSQGQGGNTNEPMCVVIVDPAMTCFRMMELPVSHTSDLSIPMDTKRCMGVNTLRKSNDLSLITCHQQYHF